MLKILVTLSRLLGKKEKRVKNLMQRADFNICKACQRVLQLHNPAAMRGVTPNLFAQSLAPAGFVRVRGHYGNCYPVVRLSDLE